MLNRHDMYSYHQKRIAEAQARNQAAMEAIVAAAQTQDSQVEQSHSTANQYRDRLEQMQDLDNAARQDEVKKIKADMEARIQEFLI